MKQCMGCMEIIDDEDRFCPYCGYTDGAPGKFILHMKPGTVLHKKYIVGSAIGWGSFGVTYIGWDSVMRRKVAIKEYLPSEYATRMVDTTMVIVPQKDAEREKYERGMIRFHKEAEKLASLGRIDGVVYIYESFEENNTAYIVMEYLDGETLESYMRSKGIPVNDEEIQDWEERKGKKDKIPCMDEQEALDIMLPVLQALEKVHEAGILHRDISPANIFLSKDYNGNQVVKLIDFGSSRYSSGSHSKSLTVLLNPGYSPEEQYNSSSEQSTFTDIYAVAAVLYHMVTGYKPVDALERRTEIEHKKRDPLKNPTRYNKQLSDNFEAAIMNGLNVKANDRTQNAEEFVSELLSFEPVKRKGQNIKRIDFMKWPLWAKITVPLGTVAALALLIFMAIRAIGPSSSINMAGKVRVSDYYGLTYEEASAKASLSGLIPEEGEQIYIQNMKPGYVCGQSISPGYIANENSVMTLDISAESEKYLMPLVIGMSKEKAQKVIECMDINVAFETSSKAGLAEGCVIAQDKDALSNVESGDTVTLTITSGETEIPSDIKSGSNGEYVGMNYEEALSKASTDGNSIVVLKREFVTNGGDGEILSQQNLGSGIVGVVASRQWSTFEMPNLNGKEKSKAIQLLENIGVTADITEEINESRKAGVVFEQSIAKYTHDIEPNTSVGITVSKGPAPFAMPDLVGMTEEEAIDLLHALGLVAICEYEYVPDTNEGDVTAQSVGADEDVTRGTTIVLKVCTLDDVETVVDVVGMEYAEAAAALKKLGFDIIKNEVENEYIEKNIVIEQDPEGNSVQKVGSTIILTVSLGASDRKTDEKIEEEEKALIKKEVFVEFDAAGGECSKGNMIVMSGKSYGSLPIPTREGYEFQGWYTSDGTKVTTETTVTGTGSQLLHAEWKEVSGTVNFDGNGGSVSTSSKQIKKGDSIGSLPSASREFYTFEGWYTSPNGGSQVSESTEMTGSYMTVYAHWSENQAGDWIADSSVPSSARVVEEKWVYTETTWTMSDKPNVSGYTLDNSKTETWYDEIWGNWSNWTTNPIAPSQTREVQTKVEHQAGEQRPVSYDMVEYNYMSNNGKRYYRSSGVGGNYSGNGYSQTYGEFNRWITVSADTLNSAQQLEYGGYMGGSNAGYNDCGDTGYVINHPEKGNLIFYIANVNYETTSQEVTYYSYRDLIREERHNYYLYKEETKESSTRVNEGNGISNVRHYVRYVSR